MNLLITAFFNLGDVILLTGALAWLKNHYPDVRVTLLVRENVRSVVENNPVIDDVIIAKYQSKQSSIAEMWRLVQVIRSHNFDEALILESKLRSAIVVRLAGVPKRVGVDGLFSVIPKKVRFLCTAVVSPQCSINKVHQTESLKSVLQQFFKAPVDYLNNCFRPVLPPADLLARESVKMLLSSELNNNKSGMSRMKIALCVRGTFALKNWPQEYFAALADALHVKYNADCFIVGVPGDKDYAEGVIALAQTPIKNFCGRTNFFEMLALLESSDLLVSVCTGTVHMASAVNLPTIAVYGCTPAVRWAPMSDKADTCTIDAECCPCSVRENDCPYGKKCLYDVKVNDVLKKIEVLLLSKC